MKRFLFRYNLRENIGIIPMQFIQSFSSKLIAKFIDFINKLIYQKYYWSDM